MYVRTSRDAYAFQCLQGRPGAGSIQTIGMNFIAPVNCLLPNFLNEISAIDEVAGAPTNVSAITIIASTATPDSAIVVTDTNGLVAMPTSIPAVGTTEWKTFFINNLTGQVRVNSTGPIAVGTFGNEGSNGGFAGYFSGFDTIPDVELVITGSGCFPGAFLSENTGPYDAYQWFNNDVLISGATTGTYTPVELGAHYVRVTRGSCSYNSAIIDVYDCDPNIVITKTDNQDPIDELQDVTFTIQVQSLGIDPVINLEIQDALPTGLSLISATLNFGTWTNPIWAIGTMTSGQIHTLIIVANADLGKGSTTIINTITNTQDQVDSNNN
jgi:uncharacterized repeat protein (TIGR01451 family)